MRNFDFAASDVRAPFRDVEAVMDSVELAKTAMRAMGKYDAQAADPPAAVLAERCRAMQKEPPPADWDGIFVSRTR
jgi:hypothetical protein